MDIFIERTKEEKSLDFSGSAIDLLKQLNLTAQEVLIIRNGTLVTEDEELDSGDNIRLLSVVSGG